MAKKQSNDFDSFIEDLFNLVQSYRSDDKPAKATKEAAPVEKDEDEGIDFGEDDKPSRDVRAKALTKTNIRTLRKQVLALGYGKDEDGDDDDDAIAEINGADKETLVETILSEEYPETEEEDADEDGEDVDDDADSDDDADDEDDEDDDEEEDEEEEAEEDEAGEWTRDDLEGLNLRELKRVAKEDFGYSAADLKGQDQETIIASLLGEDDEEEDEDDDEGDDDEYSEEELLAMSINELKALAKEYGITVKPGTKKKAIVDKILAEGE